MNYNIQTAVLSLSLHYDHQSRLIVISLDTWRGSDAIKQLSVNTLICVHNASGDTAGNGKVFCTQEYTRQKFDIKTLVNLKQHNL